VNSDSSNWHKRIVWTSVASVWVKVDLNIEECYNSFYEQHPFTFYIPEPIDLKTVVNTNRCFINLYQKDKQLVVVSYIDNLIKGASGQAVQNMNLMSGYPEHLGLQLKASTY
jgi:N-acetyl-gamma-glutamyl-phosphate reductase